MSCFYVPVKINGGEPVDFIVDTGATFCSIPEDILAANGVSFKKRRRVQLADGTERLQEWGEARLQITGLTEEETCHVLSAPSVAPALLGSAALNVFGLWVDPLGATLVKQDSVLLCRHAEFLKGRR